MAVGIPLLILLVLAIPVAVLLVMYVLVPVFKGIGWFIRHIFSFIFGEISDVLRLVGAIVTGLVLVPMTIVNVIIGRWSASAHYGRAVKSECKNGCLCIYRMAIGRPAKLLCLSALTDGLEKRLPEVMAGAPTSDTPSKRTGQFEGYKILGSLAGGGSGGKLYVAEPDARKLASFARQGQADVVQVVIKSFSLRDGSSLPQIVRESRALEAAKKLGLVLEHEMGSERFYYVMRYVPGESLGLYTQKLHASSEETGLDDRAIGLVLGVGADLLRTLQQYHRGGLWHKDVKPDNIIIHDERAHLVDFGLITPMRSAMTLTTHGTEYFRDPEMVRLALKGVKVHEVDGAKFDIYASGAVIFSMIENSFPAHGGLSQLTRRCPEALRWIVRRAMTDYDKRYNSAAEMLADLETVLLADEPFKVVPAGLPSMRGRAVESQDDAKQSEDFAAGFAAAVAGSPVPPPVPPVSPEPLVTPAPQTPATPVAAGQRGKPKLRVSDWWTGRYEVVDSEPPFPPPPPPPPHEEAQAEAQDGVYVYASVVSAKDAIGIVSRSAKEQLASARKRVKARRAQAHDRMSQHRIHRRDSFSSGINGGVVVAIVLFFGVVGILGFALLVPAFSRYDQTRVRIVQSPPDAPEALANAETLTIDSDQILDQVDRAKAQVQEAMRKVDELARQKQESYASALKLEKNARMLIQSDLNPPLDEKVGAYLKELYQTLRTAGVEVYGGPFSPTNLDEETESILVETLASLEHARAQMPLDTEKTSQVLTNWIADHKDDPGLDLVLWISPSLKGKPGELPMLTLFGSLNDADMKVIRMILGD